MIPIKYSLVIEATDDPLFFAFYSPELEGFTGVGSSIEDCIYKAIHGIEEHLNLLKEKGLSIPPEPEEPRIVVVNAKEQGRVKTAVTA